MKALLKYYFSVFLRRLHWFLIPAVALTAIGIIVAMTLPPSYVSSTRFVVESSQIPKELAPPTVADTPFIQLQIVQQRLLARGNLLDVARKLNVFPNQDQMAPDDIVAGMRKQTDINLSTPRIGTPQMTIAFTARTPQLAAAAVNEFLTTIQQADVDNRTGRAGQTMEFFQQESNRLSASLAEQSRRLLEFQSQNADALPDGQATRLTQQNQLQMQISQMGRDIAGLLEQRARMVQIFETTGRLEALGIDNRTPEQRQLDDLRNQLNSALAVYAPSNPRISVLKNRIAQLESQIAASSGGQPGLSPLDAQLAEIDKRTEALRVQQTEAEQHLDRLNDAIARTPANSVTLSALQRDYDNVQTQYNRAVASLAQASSSERVETSSQGQRISILEQPAVPSSPSKPNRPLVAAAGLGAGVVLGLALVVLLELLNRSPRRPEDLVKKLGIMPLGTIPYLRSGRELVWQRSLKAALIILILIGIPAVIWGVHNYYQPLDLLSQQVMNKMGL